MDKSSKKMRNAQKGVVCANETMGQFENERMNQEPRIKSQDKRPELEINLKMGEWDDLEI